MASQLSKINLKTWVEIKSAAIKQNIGQIRKLLKKNTQLWAVVKSNAYGHGLTDFSMVAERLDVNGFCVDSVIEGKKLRDAGIKKPILVLGPTLPSWYGMAVSNDVIITLSNFEFARELAASKIKPNFHVKIDTGMRRQGFYVDKLPRLAKFLKEHGLAKRICGAYTHFASAKDINYPTYTDWQFSQFLKGIKIFEQAGLTGKDFIRHCAATGAALIGKKYHLDAVRIGIGLYGLWPSKELEVQLSDRIALEPVLSWHAIVTEVKNAKKGDYVGYDLTEKLNRDSKLAVIPIGYWHGYDRKLSGCGEAIMNGKRTRVLGRVSMDLIVVDVTGIPCTAGINATLIGSNGKEAISASEIGQKIGTTQYEIITRVNPLIQRYIV